MPQPRTASTIPGTPVHQPMMRRRRRMGTTNKRTVSKTLTGIKFTTRDVNGGDFGTTVATILDQYITRPHGRDLALTINLIKEAWDAAGGR